MPSRLDDILDEAGSGPVVRESTGYCPSPCPSPPPPKGQFSAPGRNGHRWFTPAYRQHPSNLWHLARVVRTRMLADRSGRGVPVPSESQIRYGIQNHPCNGHFTRSKPMFMPRFGRDRCTGRGSYYGAIYIPFVFDGVAPSGGAEARHPQLGDGLALNSISPDNLCHVATDGRSCAVRRARYCFQDGHDDRAPVEDTTVVPFRWICEITLVFSEPLKRGRYWAFGSGTGLLIGPSHVLTSAHLIYQKLKFGTTELYRTPRAAVFLFGLTQEGATGRTVYPFPPIIQRRRKAFRVPQEWKDHLRGANNEPARYDYGLISLAGSAQCAPRFLGGPSFPSGFWGYPETRTRVAPGIRRFRHSRLTGHDVQLAGYPGDLQCMQIKSPGKLTRLAYGGSRSGRPHYRGTARHDILHYSIDSVSGMSGSPVWGRMTLKGRDGRRREERVLVGVHSRCGRGTALTPYVWEQHLAKWMAAS